MEEIAARAFAETIGQLPLALGLGLLVLIGAGFYFRMEGRKLKLDEKKLELEQMKESNRANEDQANAQLIGALVNPIGALNTNIAALTTAVNSMVELQRETSAELGALAEMSGQIDRRIGERHRQAEINHAAVMEELEPLRKQSDRISQAMQGVQGILENLQAGQGLLDQQIKSIIQKGDGRDRVLGMITTWIEALKSEAAATLMQLSTETTPEATG